MALSDRALPVDATSNILGKWKSHFYYVSAEIYSQYYVSQATFSLRKIVEVYVLNVVLLYTGVG